MKKTILLIIVLVLALISFSGCVTFYKDFELYEEVDQISSIQVYHFDEGFLPEKIDDSFQPIKIIDESFYQEIASDLQEIEYKYAICLIMGIDYEYELYGYVIEVRYNSGARQFLSKSVTYTLDANGKVVDSQEGGIDDEIWYSLLLKCAAPEWPSLQS